MARLTRHELKRDEITARLAGLLEFFLSHQRRILLTTLVAVLVLAAATGGLLYLRSRQARAAAAFTSALTTYHALVVPTPPPGFPMRSFKSAADKNQEALKEFTEVAERFPAFSQARWARYYAALCKRDLGNLAEAEKELEVAARDGNEDLAAVAKLALAGLYLETDRTPEAEKLYRDLESHPTTTVPKVTAQLALAELYQKSEPAKAAEIYQQIEKENPGTAAADLASQMLGNSPL